MKSEETSTTFLKIAVALPVQNTFTYRDPRPERAAPIGAQIIVPFGTRTMTEFVIARATATAVDAKGAFDKIAGLAIGLTIVFGVLMAGPLTGGAFNPARAFGPELVSAIGGGATQWAQLAPVYILPGLAGAGLAAVVYDALATPRKVTAPIKSAVTHPDTADAAGVAAVK